jgi:hypothetical protein
VNLVHGFQELLQRLSGTMTAPSFGSLYTVSWFSVNWNRKGKA